MRSSKIKECVESPELVVVVGSCYEDGRGERGLFGRAIKLFLPRPAAGGDAAGVVRGAKVALQTLLK